MFQNVFQAIFLCLAMSGAPLFANIMLVPYPSMIGVVERLPGNHTLQKRAGQKVEFGCRLKYIGTGELNDSMPYYWQRDGRVIWHSQAGKKNRDPTLKFQVVDAMKTNRTIMIVINSLHDSNYGRYTCVFGDLTIKTTTRLCVGQPTWDQLRYLCSSRLAKSINITATPKENPVLVNHGDKVTFTCKVEPKHKALLASSVKYKWTIGDNYQMWFNGGARPIAPPNAVFALDREKQEWSMTVPNVSSLIGRMPRCHLLLRRIDLSYPFAVAERPPPPQPVWVKDYLPKSGYFGVFWIFLMIWMLLALNKTNS